MRKLCPGLLATHNSASEYLQWQLTDEQVAQDLVTPSISLPKNKHILFFLLFVPCLASLAKICVNKSSSVVSSEDCYRNTLIFLSSFSGPVHIFHSFMYFLPDPSTHTHTHTKLSYWETGTCEQSSLYNGHNRTRKTPKLQGPKVCARAPAVLCTYGTETPAYAAEAGTPLALQQAQKLLLWKEGSEKAACFCCRLFNLTSNSGAEPELSAVTKKKKKKGKIYYDHNHPTLYCSIPIMELENWSLESNYQAGYIPIKDLKNWTLKSNYQPGK